MPDYGMGFEAFVEEEEAPAVDSFVETDDWTSAVAPMRLPPTTIAFADGVRRADLRIIASEAGRRVPGLIGTFAVGIVRCDGSATFGEYLLGHALIIGGGIQPPDCDLRVGGRAIAVKSVSEPGSEPHLPLWRLQRLMRDAEASLAANTAAAYDGIVLADGPLTFHDPTNCPIVGLAKRFHRLYLEPQQGQLLTRLRAGERTPIFLLGKKDSRVQRYAWYARIVELGRPWHDHTGLVRCEVRVGIGLGRAKEVADEVALRLPSFAGRRADPRTPQNLAPVAGLEAWLRHRMGDTQKIRRAALEWMTSSEVAA